MGGSLGISLFLGEVGFEFLLVLSAWVRFRCESNTWQSVPKICGDFSPSSA